MKAGKAVERHWDFCVSRSLWGMHRVCCGKPLWSVVLETYIKGGEQASRVSVSCLKFQHACITGYHENMPVSYLRLTPLFLRLWLSLSLSYKSEEVGPISKGLSPT